MQIIIALHLFNNLYSYLNVNNYSLYLFNNLHSYLNANNYSPASLQ